METRRMKLALSAGALALSMALAGCGGGGEPAGPTQAELDAQAAEKRRMEQTGAIMTAIGAAETAVLAISIDNPTQDKVDAADTAIGNANAAITAATDVDDTSMYTAEVAGLQQTVDTAKNLVAANAGKTEAETELAEKEEAERKAQAEADAKMARALLKALDPMLTTRATDPLPMLSVTVSAKHGAAPSITAQTTSEGTSTGVPDPKFGDGTAADAVPGGWSGWEVIRKDKTNADTMVVYSNIGAPTSTPFAEHHDVDNDGKISMTAAADGNIASPHFAKTGRVVHEENARHQDETEDSFVEFPGTYNGAAGRYTCDADCVSQRGSDGKITLGTNWSFTANQGAMVSVADASYQNFGWWLRKEADGMPAQVHAFAGGSTDTKFGDATAVGVVGKAKFDGAAAGKYAIDDPLPGNPSNGGHWTAAVSLTADFDATLTGGTTGAGTIGGEIKNFMVGGASMPWSVELKTSEIGVGSGTDDHFSGGNTVWTINGRAATESGAWMGSFYNSGKARNDGLPSAAVGTFNADYGTAGRMAGAFGVSNSESDTPKN